VGGKGGEVVDERPIFCESMRRFQVNKDIQKLKVTVFWIVPSTLWAKVGAWEGLGAVARDQKLKNNNVAIRRKGATRIQLQTRGHSEAINGNP